MTDYNEEKRILRQAISQKKLIVFVGSGLSMDSGMPDWRKAVENIAQKLSLPINDIKAEDYLKIPQYYYNSRGKKEYVELMRQIFKENEELSVTENQKKIVSLGTHTIITTNYDDLLEKAAAEQHEMIQVISHDKGLPYKSAEREIIKMHGDFLHDNFVLKEDDYTHYSENFTLLEAYIKSLIATNVVLFVGYSFSDPDVKQIFRWVKDVLEEDFQRAYLLQIYDDYDEYKFEYYKNLGVNVIYANEMRGYKELGLSEKLYKFLDSLTNSEIEENIIEKLYSRCQPYRELNYIRESHVCKLFKEYNPYIEDNAIILTSNTIDALKSIFDNPQDYHSSIIKQTIEKSNVKRVSVRTDRGLINDRLIVDNEYMRRFHNSQLFIFAHLFDYSSLRQLREANECELTDSKPELYTQQAYISYVLGEYAKSYNYLKISSQLYYRNKQYSRYLISEFNRYNVGYLACSEFSEISLVKEKIRSEIQSINLDDLLDKTPNTPDISKELIRDIYTYRIYYYDFQKIYQISLETHEETKNKYIMKSNPSYIKMRNAVMDCFYFEQYNYIMFDRYRENVELYRLYSKTIIASAMSKDIISTDAMFNSYQISNIHVRALDSFDLLIILRYLQRDELEELLYEYNNRRITLDDDAKGYFVRVCNNLVDDKEINNEYYWKMLCFSSSIVLDCEVAKTLLQSLLGKIKYIKQNIVCVKYISKLLYTLNELGLLNNVSCFEAFQSVIDSLLIFKTDLDITRVNRINTLIKNALYISWSNGFPYYSAVLMKTARKQDYAFLADIYNYVDTRIQRQIFRTVKKWQWSGISDDVEDYTSMVISGLIPKDEQVESSIFSMIANDININGISVYSDTSEQIRNSLLTLYLNNKLVNSETAKELIIQSRNEINTWLIQMESFDYSSFKIEWLIGCSESLLKSISQIPRVREIIVQKIKHAYQVDEITDRRILNIFFHYFI